MTVYYCDIKITVVFALEFLLTFWLFIDLLTNPVNAKKQ